MKSSGPCVGFLEFADEWGRSINMYHQIMSGSHSGDFICNTYKRWWQWTEPLHSTHAVLLSPSTWRGHTRRNGGISRDFPYPRGQTPIPCLTSLELISLVWVISQSHNYSSPHLFSVFWPLPPLVSLVSSKIGPHSPYNHYLNSLLEGRFCRRTPINWPNRSHHLTLETCQNFLRHKSYRICWNNAIFCYKFLRQEIDKNLPF